MTFVQQTSTFVVGEERPLPIWHLDGVPWWKARIPRRWHKCRTQTYAEIDGEKISRCACGAIQYHGRFGNTWGDRNTRRKTR